MSAVETSGTSPSGTAPCASLESAEEVEVYELYNLGFVDGLSSLAKEVVVYGFYYLILVDLAVAVGVVPVNQGVPGGLGGRQVQLGAAAALEDPGLLSDDTVHLEHHRIPGCAIHPKQVPAVVSVFALPGGAGLGLDAIHLGGDPGAVGRGGPYEDYINSLQHVFAEVYRKTMPGGRFVINVSNMKARQSIEGQAFIYPIVADTIKAMGKVGFTFFDEIIWHKKRGNAGALEGSPLWGSYPYPPTPKILDSTFENILVFTKPGQREVDLGIKEQSRLTLDEWREYTKGIWRIESGSEAIHPATFPMEVAERIVRLYSFVGDLVLDPFAGTGTTIVSAEKNLRAGVGYEITPIYQEAVRHKAEQWLENVTE